MSFLKRITIQCEFLLNTTAKFSQLVVFFLLLAKGGRSPRVVWVLCRCMERVGDQKMVFVINLYRRSILKRTLKQFGPSASKKERKLTDKMNICQCVSLAQTSLLQLAGYVCRTCVSVWVLQKIPLNFPEIYLCFEVKPLSAKYALKYAYENQIG